MRRRILGKWLLSITCMYALGFPAAAHANGGSGGIDRGGRGGGHGGHGAHAGPEVPERNVGIEVIGVGDTRSVLGNASVRTTGVLIETEYERNYKVFSLNFERWQYDWTNPQNLPFVSGTAADPWKNFYTVQLGFEYEQEINRKLELYYYIEAESTFEREMSNSNEYEIGMDFEYEANKDWTFVLNFNYEYLDSEGGELGMDMEIEWKPHNQKGWSGVFEVSSEFPESSLTYHFNKSFSTSFFLGEGGSNTVRLSDTSPVTGMQGGYLEDEFRRAGVRFSYHWGHESYLSFSIENNFDRQMTFVDKSGNIEVDYAFKDVMGASLYFSYEF